MKKKMKSNQSNATNPHTEQLTFMDILEEPESSVQKLKEEYNDEKQDFLYPIQLVRDFKQFIQYLEIHQVQITKTKGYISRRYLPDINGQLSIQNKAATSHTEQEYYPYIHFFYFLVLRGCLFEKVPAKGGKVKLHETDRLSLFRKLSDAEKYFFLLETFWVDVDWDDLQDERYNRVPESVQDIFYFFMEKNTGDLFRLNQSLNINEKILSDCIRNWNHFFLYFKWLGLWECEIDQEAIDRYYRKNRYLVRSIKLTEFGLKMIPVLLLERNLQFWNTSLRSEHGEVNPIPGSPLEESIFILPEEIEGYFLQHMEDIHVQPFLQSFKKLFPTEDLQRSLPRQTRKFIDGLYTLKVTYMSGIWRTVVLTGRHTMHHLHEVILEAYEFDDDHLYSFFMDGKKWSKKSIVSPLDDFGQSQADKVRIGDMGLIQGQLFKYLYDYGDEWTFSIVVEQIIEQDSELLRPYVIGKKGDGPEQYMKWG